MEPSINKSQESAQKDIPATEIPEAAKTAAQPAQDASKIQAIPKVAKPIFGLGRNMPAKAALNLGKPAAAAGGMQPQPNDSKKEESVPANTVVQTKKEAPKKEVPKRAPPPGAPSPRTKGPSFSLLGALAKPSSFIVWAICVAAAVYLYFRGVEFEVLIGRVETLQEQIAPLETARLISISITAGQSVTNGQPVAQMDTGIIDAEIAQQEASLARDIGNTDTRIQAGLLQMYERFTAAVSAAETALAMENRLHAEDMAELKTLDEEIALYNDRVKSGISTISDISMAKSRQSVLKERLNQHPKTIEELEKNLADARTNTDLLKNWLESGTNDQSLDVLRRKLQQRQSDIEQEIIMLKARRERYTLRATRDGIVSRVFVEPGSVVPAGTTVILTVEKSSQRVTAFLSDTSQPVPLNTPATITRRTIAAEKYPAYVETLSPEIEILPSWNSQVLTQVMRGRRMSLIVTTTHDLLPGEVVSVSVAAHGSGYKEQLAVIKTRIKSIFLKPSARPPAVKTHAVETVSGKTALDSPEKTPAAGLGTDNQLQ